MGKLNDSAHGKECFVRIPGVCNHDSRTTILARLNGGNHDDLFGAFCCADCLEEYDRRTRKQEKSFVDLCFFQGMQRTQQYWLDNGLVVTK